MRAKTVYFLGATATSTSWVFIPILASELGASNYQLGIIGMGYGLALFLSSYFFGRLSDNIGRKFILVTGLILSSVTFGMQFFAQGPYSLLMIRILCGAALGMYPPVLMGYVADRKGRMGKFSSYQSLGWCTGTLLAGFIASYLAIFTLSALLFLVAAIIAMGLEEENYIPRNVPRFPKKIIMKNASLYIAYIFRHTGAQMVWIIFPVFLTTLNISKALIGIVFAANSFVQFIVMQVSDRWDARGSVVLGLFLSSLAFVVLSQSYAAWHFLVGMLIIGLSWGFLYSGSIRFLVQENPEYGTVSGALQSAISFSAIIGPLLGGMVAQAFGYRATFYFAAVMAFTGFLIFGYSIWFRRSQQIT